MASKTRRQRESDLKLASQGLTLLALLLGSYVWYRTSSLVVGGVIAVLAVVFIEICLILPDVVRRHRLQACGYDQVYEMNGEEFEEYLQALFIAKGYRASLTPNGSDFGADLIVEKNGQKTAVQAKHWASRDVGVTAVQEVRAAQDYYHARKAMVVNVGTYTKQAVDLAKACQVELWDGPRLQREVLGMDHRAAPTGQLVLEGCSDLPAAENRVPSCPQCGSAMVQRKSEYGQFWGCSHFPACRRTRRV